MSLSSMVRLTTILVYTTFVQAAYADDVYGVSDMMLYQKKVIAMDKSMHGDQLMLLQGIKKGDVDRIKYLTHKKYQRMAKQLAVN